MHNMIKIHSKYKNNASCIVNCQPNVKRCLNSKFSTSIIYCLCMHCTSSYVIVNLYSFLFIEFLVLTKLSFVCVCVCVCVGGRACYSAQ